MHHIAHTNAFSRLCRFPRWAHGMGGLLLVALTCAILSAAPGYAEAQQQNEINTVTRVNNIYYRTVTNDTTDYERERCFLDLYLPTGAKGFSTMVWFHGGGMGAGSKEDNVALGEFFARKGIAVASVNYRLSPRAKYPAYVDDAAASVAWVLQHIVEYGGSSTSVFVSGHSAGGYLTAMVGMAPSYLAKYGVDVSSIAGLIPVSGQAFTHFTVRNERGVKDPMNTPVIDDAAPCYYVRKDTPPLLVIMGDHDWPARAEENEYFIAALKVMGNKNVAYQEFADRDHGTIISRITEPNDPVAEAMLKFMRDHTR